jgi:hypothetical protein
MKRKAHDEQSKESDLGDKVQFKLYLRQGEAIEIRKRKQVIGRLVPVRSKADYPDFGSSARKIFGNRKLSVTGAELVSWGRE